MTGAPVSGLWRLAGDGTVSFVRPEFHPAAIADDTQALFIRTIDTGQIVSKGRCLGRLLTRSRLLTDDWRLNSRAKAWVRGFRQQFATPASADLAGAR